MNKYRDFRRRRDRGSLASTVRQQDGSIKIRLVHRAAINIPIKVGRASSVRLENVSSLSLYSMLDVVGLSRVKREKNFPGYSFFLSSPSLFFLLSNFVFDNLIFYLIRHMDYYNEDYNNIFLHFKYEVIRCDLV